MLNAKPRPVLGQNQAWGAPFLCLLVPLIIPLPVMALGIFASSVQALVFATLSAAYIAESVE